MTIIESKENPLFKEIKKLKDKRHRTLEGKFIVEGLRFVKEALDSDFSVEYLIVCDESKDKFNIDYEALKSYTKVYLMKYTLVKALSETENPQGILAIVNKKNNQSIKDNGFYVLIDKVQDPGNAGTIIRSAHASGVSGIIITKGTVDLYNDKTLRATMGSIFHIPIIEDFNYSIVESLKNKGYRFIVSSLEGEKNFFDENLKGNMVICVGNEGNGISSEIYSMADVKVKIPMPGGAESLNVAVAASIMMFEVVRQNM